MSGMFPAMGRTGRYLAAALLTWMAACATPSNSTDGAERVADAGVVAAGRDATSAHLDESPYALVDRPGPALRVSRDALDASLRCPAALDAVDQPVVLLIPGTTVTPQEAFEWNYARAFAAEGIPYCMVTVPEHTNGDIQVAAEYVVDAVRNIHAATDHRVILLGWSQGASTLPRWAIRFWPDIRPMISDLIGLAPLNNAGSLVADALCLPGACIPAGWQQRNGSAFIDALNSRQPVFDDIDYTVIYSRVDTVVTPNLDGGLSVLPEGPNVTNVAISDVCPTDLSEHLLIVASPVAWAFALDAIRHPGEPADPTRVVAPALCAPGLMPHVSPIDVLLQEVRIAANVGPRVLEGQVSAEPPLADYVFAD